MASEKKNSVSSIDPYVDIAILKSTKTQFRNVRDPLPYSKAYTLHLLCDSPTVYTDRVLPGQPEKLKQHIDTPIWEGFSGGPVLNIDGTVLDLISKFHDSPVRRCTYIRTSAFIYILQLLDHGYINYKKWKVKAISTKQPSVKLLAAHRPSAATRPC